MPPRRSARAASAKPVSQVAEKPAAKPASKAATKPTSKAAPKPTSRAAKRPASPENDPPPPAKRSRAPPKVVENGVVPKDTAKAAPAPRKPAGRPARAPRQPVAVVHHNPLPTAPEHVRPAPLLFVWGAGNFGQFGMGPDALGDFEKPRRNPWVEKAIKEGRFGEEGAGFETIAAGGLHSLFIDEKGTVWSCGVNDDAALGRITTNVPNPDKEGEFLDIDTLTAQPYPLQSLVDENFRAVRIAAGDTISAAISDQGDLRVWGCFRGVEGILGFSSGSKHQFLPAPLPDLKASEKFTSVVAGNNHLLVMTSQGGLYAWGAGEQGQLGRRVLERRKIHGTVPEKIVLGTRTHKAVAIGAGSYTSFAVDDKGEVWAWGLNNMGQTGTGFRGAQDSEVSAPKRVVGLSKAELGGEEHVVQIAGGEHHTLFLTSAGKVYACGRSDGGQLGIDKDDEAFKDAAFPDMLETPARITFPDDDDDDDPIVHISAGIHNNLAISQAGALYSWGTGPQGELGAGDQSELKTPKAIVRKEGGKFASVVASCGGQHSLALLREKS
ncbi:RCC1/BLIP-II [Cristinia sonorae]|uniref:RCC1/BLIP-II n=1 Tax=Cristinia sonorae TaxID=1940300 RepID=A0A8K0XN08_9AGAR|nr:RCC1/BLIP-II [Cristinia sonorae]